MVQALVVVDLKGAAGPLSVEGKWQVGLSAKGRGRRVVLSAGLGRDGHQVLEVETKADDMGGYCAQQCSEFVHLNVEEQNNLLRLAEFVQLQQESRCSDLESYVDQGVEFWSVHDHPVSALCHACDVLVNTGLL